MSISTEHSIKRSQKNEDYMMSLFIDSEFYESIDRHEHELNYYNIAIDILRNDDSWKIKKDRVFINCINENSKLLNQGWKIHISGIPKNSEEILIRTINICKKYEVNFKFLCDNHLLVLSSSKAWPRGSSGKFITIYPESEQVFINILKVLYNELRNFEGPYILSDKRYKDDCKVLYYRYGGMAPKIESNFEGKSITYLESPLGEKIPDYRLPFYNKPYWANDPFGDDNLSQSIDSSLKNGRYNITKVLKFSNSGGVYIAFDNQTNQQVIIKEARPYTTMNQYNNIDAIELRKREWDIINIMQHEQIVPRPIDNFFEWEHFYLVESIIDGEDLQFFTASKNPLLHSNLYSSSGQKNSEVKDFFEDMIMISKNLAISLKLFHENNIVVGDFSAFNVMVKKDLGVAFPDLEGSYNVNNKYTKANQFTPGYYNKKYSNNDSSPYLNDYYALGCIICNMFSPQTYQYKINPEAPRKFLRELGKDFNLPKDFIEIIIDLIYFTENVSIKNIINRLENIHVENMLVEQRINEKLDSRV